MPQGQGAKTRGKPMRTHYLIAYDISCPQRLYRVHRFLLGYKVGGQKSCFDCWLSPAELSQVIQTLKHTINKQEDRIHLFAMDPRLPHTQYGKQASKLEAQSNYPAFYLL